MPRRYRRDPNILEARRNVPLWAFPAGEGPAIQMDLADPGWPRLGPGKGALVGGERGVGGALAYGLAQDLAVVWAVHEGGRPFAAYLLHALPGPISPTLHRSALDAIGVGVREVHALWVLVASQREIADEEVALFESLGVGRDRVLVYSGALLPQFGVRAEGWVGEAG